MTGRAGAAFGSAIGFGIGAVSGGYTVHALKQGRASETNIIDGAIVGAFVGTIAGAAIGSGPSTPQRLTTGVGKPMTPAQASGVPDFVNDWPVQGPTDPGIRAADCRYAQTLPTPQEAPCVDCKGPIPMWAQTKGLLGEQVSFGGRGVRAFALAAAGDSDVWAKLNPAQQKWVMESITTLNNLIYQSTGTMCPTWGPSITAAGGCFQNWFNANAKLTNPNGSPVKLRTDGVFDQDTLNALNTITAMDPPHFPQAFPPGYITSAAPEEKKISTGAIVGIAAAGATALGGIVYVATRKRGRKSRRK